MSGLGWLGVASQSYEREKEALRDILAGDEYAVYATGEDQGQNLLLLWLKKLVDKLGELFPRLAMTDSSESAVSYVIIGVGIALLIFLTLYVVRLLWVERRLKRATAAAAGDELERTPPELLELADRKAEAGDYREAARLLFLSLLLALQAQEQLEVRSWKTNWEYAEELAAAGSPHLGVFQESALRFDALWYGHRELQPGEFKLWRDRASAFIGGSGGKAA